MATIFEQIIAREIPGFFIYEDERCVAIMDKFPAVPGQVVVFPVQPVDYAFALDDDTYHHLLTVARVVAAALDTVFQTERTCLVIEGFEVPHAHIKLYPMTSTTEPLGAVMSKTAEATDEQLKAHAAQVRAALTQASI